MVIFLDTFKNKQINIKDDDNNKYTFIDTCFLFINLLLEDSSRSTVELAVVFDLTASTILFGTAELLLLFEVANEIE